MPKYYIITLVFITIGNNYAVGVAKIRFLRQSL
jgi:hypothetical protein